MRTILLSLLIGAALPGALPAQGLQLSPGIYWVSTGAPSVVLNNTGIISNGLFVPGNGTLFFTGDDPAAISSIGGNRPLSLYSIVIATSSHEVRLDNDITIRHTLALDSGNLELNGHLMDLGSSGDILGERNAARITGATGGQIRRSAELNAPQETNPGNIGVAISSPADLGFVTITRGHVPEATGAGGTSIQRYFDIAPAVNGGLQATLQFNYLDGELAGNSKGGLMLFASTEVGSNWTALGRSSNSTDSDWVAQSHLDKLQRFTLAAGFAGSGDRVLAEAYPNPAHDGFELKLTSSVEKDATLGLYDATGRLLEVKRVHCMAGVTLVEWGITRYASGVYYLGFQGLAAQDLKMIKQ
jgi:hypothetical protein